MPSNTSPKLHKCVVTSWLLALGTLLASVAEAQPTQVAASSEDSVSELILQLDAGRFSQRKRARQLLVEFGIDVVKPVERLILENAANRDLQMQGLAVLFELIRLDRAGPVNEAAQTAAVASLEGISRSHSNRATRLVAERMLTTHGKAVSRIALRELMELGARDSLDEFPHLLAEFDGDLKKIEIGLKWKGTPQDLKRLTVVNGLTHIALRGERITDACLIHVARVPKLRVLHLDSTSVTAAGLVPLAKAELLSQFELRDTKLSDEDGQLTAALAQLKAAQIRLIGTGLDAKTVDRLIAKIPPTKAKLHFGAFLGVGPVELAGDGCRLNTIAPGSAAKKADLRIDDMITKFNDTPIENFEQLRDLISLKSPGDVVRIEIRRLKHKQTPWQDLGPPLPVPRDQVPPQAPNRNQEDEKQKEAEQDEEGAADNEEPNPDDPYETLTKQVELGELPRSLGPP